MSTIRKATPDDFLAILKLNAYCYGFNYKKFQERFQKRFEFIYDEQFVVEDSDGKVIASSRSIPFEQNIRGKWLPMVGIGMVSSDPVTRRSGFVRELMLKSLEDMKEKNIAVTTLYPFKDSFYGSLGYVSAAPRRSVILSPENLSLWRNYPTGYSIERVTYEAGFEELKTIHNKKMTEIHGSVRRSQKRWKEFEGEKPHEWILRVLNEKNQLVGLMDYVNKGFSSGYDWSEEGEIIIRGFYPETIEAQQVMFGYLYRHQDQIVKIKLPLFPNLSPIWPWLRNYSHVKFDNYTVSMSRIVDVKQTLTNFPIGSANGKIPIKIIDNQCNWNQRLYLFEGTNGSLTIKEIETEPKQIVKLTIEGLSALVYGLLPARDLPAFQWISQQTTELMKLLQNWFPLENYYLTEDF
jgi:predicted acetyltransferase